MLAELKSILGDRLILHGVIPGLEVARQLASISLLVAPSLEEMFGNQFIDSLLMGADAVVAQGTAMADNARRFQAGHVVPQNDPQALAESIRDALANPISDEQRCALRQRLLANR